MSTQGYEKPLQVFNSISHSIAALTHETELNTQREIPYLQLTMHCFVYYPNTLPT